MKSNSSFRMAHEYVVSEEAFEKTTQIMSTEVSIPCSGRYNSIYDENDLHRSLIGLSIANGYAESGMENLLIAERQLAGRNVPSGSWIRDTVRKVPEKEMISRLENALSSTVEQLASFRVFTVPIMAAADIHNIPRYDPNPDGGFLRRTKPERGTTTFESYMTLHCVEEGRRAQLACEHVGLFDEKEVVLERILIQSTRLSEIEIYLLLLDRGFFNSSTIEMLNRTHQSFLMPCVKNKGIKRAIIECSEGKRKSISEYTMSAAADESCKFTLVILSRANTESETDPLEKYVAFATNIPLGDILWNVRKLPEDYRRRWGIESGYIGVEEFRARTTSRNHTLRLLYFYYAMILYNAWLLANLILAKKFNILDRMNEPIISVRLIKGVFQRLVIESFLHLQESGGGGYMHNPILPQS